MRGTYKGKQVPELWSTTTIFPLIHLPRLGVVQYRRLLNQHNLKLQAKHRQISQRQTNRPPTTTKPRHRLWRYNSRNETARMLKGRNEGTGNRIVSRRESRGAASGVYTAIIFHESPDAYQGTRL